MMVFICIHELTLLLSLRLFSTSFILDFKISFSDSNDVTLLFSASQCLSNDSIGAANQTVRKRLTSNLSKAVGRKGVTEEEMERE